MFNNCDSKSNGEHLFLTSIKNKVHVIFDVGCHSDSEFISFEGEVHYFDPMSDFINMLSKQPNNNKVSYFNSFGLGNETKKLYYYPKYQSFCNRANTFNLSDEPNKFLLDIRRANDYIVEKEIKSIDFLKIDTEGYELDVLLGFGDYLKSVKIIQFEYGGSFLDRGIKLVDVITYLEQKGFYKFSYLTSSGTKLLEDFKDHYQYCNIVCINKNIDFIPF